MAGKRKRQAAGPKLAGPKLKLGAYRYTRHMYVYVLALALVAAGAWAYATSFTGVLVLDDVRAIARNASIRTLWPPSTPLSPPPASTVSGRPIANFSFAINYAFAPPDARDVFAPVGPGAGPGTADAFRRNVWGYHFLNLAIHLAAALALFGVVRRTLASARFRPLFGAAATWLAFAVAVVWAVHPLQTAAVTYVVQRVESLAGLFYLLTLYCAIRAGAREEGIKVQGSGKAASRARWWTAAAVVFCALGMATKEVMVTAPIVVWLWQRTFAPNPSVLGGARGDPGPVEGSTRRLAHFRTIALFATWLILVALVVHEHRSPSIALGAAASWHYLTTQAAVIVHYLRLAVVPAPLVFLYTWPIASSFGPVAWQAALVAALVLLTIAGLVRRHPLGFAGAWFFLILAPTSSVLPIVTEVAAEQRMYLPLAAVVACAAIAAYLAGRACLTRMALQPASRARVAAGAGAVLTLAAVVVLGATTRARSRDYATETGLWHQTVEAQPGNERARVAYGVALMAERRFAEAEAQLQVAADLDWADPFAHGRLGAALAAQGKLDGAIRHLERAVALRPEDVDAQRWLGQAYAMRRSDALALAHFDRALAGGSEDVGLLVEMAGILADSREPSVRDPSRAVQLAGRAAELTARADPRALDVLAVAQAAAGRYADAAATAAEALRLAQAAGNTGLASEMESRVAAYRARASAR